MKAQELHPGRRRQPRASGRLLHAVRRRRRARRRPKRRRTARSRPAAARPALGATLNLNADLHQQPDELHVDRLHQHAAAAARRPRPRRARRATRCTRPMRPAPADPVTLTVNWGGGGGGGGGAVSDLHAYGDTSASLPSVQHVTLTATCNNTPASYEWMLCSATIGNPGDPRPRRRATSIPTCASDLADVRRDASPGGCRALRGRREEYGGTGPKVYVDMAWTGAGGGGGGGAAAVAADVPVCSISPSNHTPSTGSTITLTATCSGNPTSYDWIGEASSARAPRPPPARRPGTSRSRSPTGCRASTRPARADAPTRASTWTQTTPQPPACTLSASNMTPQVGQTITITASCTNSPLSYTWTGCTSTTSSCTDSVDSRGRQAVQADRRPTPPATARLPSVTVNWQPLPTAAPVCTVTQQQRQQPVHGPEHHADRGVHQLAASYAWTAAPARPAPARPRRPARGRSRTASRRRTSSAPARRRRSTVTWQTRARAAATSAALQRRQVHRHPVGQRPALQRRTDVRRLPAGPGLRVLDHRACRHRPHRRSSGKTAFAE